MKRKLWTCFAAALTIFAGSSYLAAPAEAAEALQACSIREATYAQGYADGYCQAEGGSGGVVTSCDSSGFYFYCY